MRFNAERFSTESQRDFQLKCELMSDLTKQNSYNNFEK